MQKQKLTRWEIINKFECALFRRELQNNKQAHLLTNFMLNFQLFVIAPLHTLLKILQLLLHEFYILISQEKKEIRS